MGFFLYLFGPELPPVDFKSPRPFFLELGIFICMKFIITENKIEKLKTHIQSQINSELNNLREESEDWGLGEMDELYEIDSINRIEVDRIDSESGIKVYVNIYQNGDYDRDDYYNVISSIEYGLENWLPNMSIILNEIIVSE